MISSFGRGFDSLQLHGWGIKAKMTTPQVTGCNYDIKKGRIKLCVE